MTNMQTCYPGNCLLSINYYKHHCFYLYCVSYYLLVMYLFVYCIIYVYVSMGHVHMDFESFHAPLKLLNKKIKKMYSKLLPKASSSIQELRSFVTR